MEIDRLIDIVAKGGSIKTGMDIHSRDGALLLEKNVRVNKVSTLLVIKQSGLYNLDIDPASEGGVWDKSGRLLPLISVEKTAAPEVDTSEITDVENRIRQIARVKKEAAQKFKKAKNNITKVISEIRESGGQFDVQLVEDTVLDIYNFLNRNSTAFSSLTKEIFSYDDYLYNHSVNVCTIGTAILSHFNDHFSEIINGYLASISLGKGERGNADILKFYNYYQPSELRDMSMGYFLHDVGKVLIPDKVLNKAGNLSAEEFQIVRTHSYEKGVEILDKNRINNAIIENVLSNHHSGLFIHEQRCYPDNKLPIEIPPYVKIAKLADIYDAMTSKRCYKDAFNPINAVANIFRSYANKDPFLQVVLHSFVKIIGIYPPGSILALRNGQMAYVLLSDGPIILPCTDNKGQPLTNKPDPIDLGSIDFVESPQMQIDKRRPLNAPTEVIGLLPSYITKLLKAEN